ncbi:MAG TPA: hypothetical protein VE078_03080 [Thermoanaerobaculia bacterium]|nr:hypothetical protein [Thermoanaerobaculia bacterium]
MSSKEPFDLLDLERDIPTTAEDIRVLHVLWANPFRWGEDWLEHLQKLVDQMPNAHEIRRRRPTFKGCEPFEL